MSEWLTESLRVTVFPMEKRFPQDDWWKQITGEDPEAVVNRPKDGFVQTEGPFLDGRLLLRTGSRRADWFLVPSGPLDASDIPSLGFFENASQAFIQKLSQWWRVCPDITRMAFGAVLLKSYDGLDAGFDLLSRYLKHHVSLDRHSMKLLDFIYRVNRPRVVKSAYPEINRIAQWSAVELKTIELNIPPGTGTPSEARSGDPVSAIRLELDISTDQHHPDRIDQTVLKDLCHDLVQLATEMSEHGDI